MEEIEKEDEEKIMKAINGGKWTRYSKKFKSMKRKKKGLNRGRIMVREGRIVSLTVERRGERSYRIQRSYDNEFVI